MTPRPLSPAVLPADSSAAAASPTTYCPPHPFQRAVDLLVLMPLALVALPLVALAAVLIRLTSRGPAFYNQVRLGANGKPFHICKLRTMYRDSEAESGICWSTAGDVRVTAVGRVLRKMHIDELPQLWNILRGEMSVVGPRPERPEIVADLETAIPLYRDRLLVRPGLTGLAQIQLPADATPDCVRRKLVFDLEYVQNRGALIDLRIVAGTGLYLAGVSFARVRRWVGLPAPAVVAGVRSYRLPSGTYAPLLDTPQA